MITPVQETEKAEAVEVSWTSEDLLKGTSDAVIVHRGEKYHLKKTKNDRLILTK